MIRKLIPIILLTGFLSSSAAAEVQQDALFTSLLQKYIEGGRVNYRELCKDSSLEQYISWLKSAEPDGLPDEKDRLAFWINAYNAYTLKLVCANYPIKSINDLHSGGLIFGSIFNTTIWDKEFVIIHNETTTLNHIEHKIIRPTFKDPRIHFALVCAAKSCPPLRTEAFEGNKLDQQLDDQGRVFLSQTSKNRFDVANRRAQISKIFDWYKKDFGKDEKQVLIYLSQFLPDTIRAAIQSNPNKWEIDFTDYDWSLNE